MHFLARLHYISIKIRILLRFLDMSATLQEALARLAVDFVGFELMLLDINDLFAICTISGHDIFRPLSCRDLADLVCE